MRSVLLVLFLLLPVLLMTACGGNPTDTAGNSESLTAPETVKESVEVNLLDFASYKTGNDWSLAFSQAAKKGDIIYVPAGEYTLSSFAVPSGKTVRGDGERTVIRGTSREKSIFSCIGSAGLELNIVGNIENHSNRAAVSNTSSFRVGDTVLVLSQRNVAILENCGIKWCLSRAYEGNRSSFFSEFKTVSAIDGNTLIFGDTFVFPGYRNNLSEDRATLPPPSDAPGNWKPYVRPSTTVSRINTVKNVIIKDIKVIPGAGTPAVDIQYASGITLENVRGITDCKGVEPMNTRLVRILNSLDCVVTNCSFRYDGTLDFDYRTAAISPHYTAYTPIIMQTAQNIVIENCTLTEGTHGIYVGTLNKGGISTDIEIRNCIMSGFKWSGVYVSSGCYDTRILNNRITDCAQGIKHGSRKTLIRGNYIDLSVPVTLDFVYCRKAAGGPAGIMLIEGYCVDTVVADNTVMNGSSGIVIRDGGEKTNIYEYGNIEISGNLIEGCTYGVFFYKHEENTKACDLDITVKNNTFKETGYTNALYGLYVCERVQGITVRNNLFDGFENVLYLDIFTDGICLADNTVTNNRRLIFFEKVSEAQAAQDIHKGLSTTVNLSGNTVINGSDSCLNDAQKHITLKKS